MGGRRPFTITAVVAVSGWLSIGGLLVTAAFGLWLDVVHDVDAGLAWNDIEAVQTQIARADTVDGIRTVAGGLTVGLVVIWLVSMSVSRRRLALGVGLVLGLSLVARWLGSESDSSQRWLLELLAAALAMIVAVAWHTRAPSAELGRDRVAV